MVKKEKDMDSKQKAGYVYILTNPSFQKDWIKIGKSSRPVDIRSKELDNTAVPLPFNIYATLQSVKYNEIEKLVHKTIDRLTDLRIRQSREFFNVEPSVALDIFKDIAKTIDDAVIVEYEGNSPILPAEKERLSSRSARRERFRFSMVNIPVGEMITFIPRNIEVRVASENQVEYEDRLYKLSPFVGTFMPEDQRNTSGAYQGAKYFSYKGKVLEDIRKELEEQC